MIEELAKGKDLFGERADIDAELQRVVERKSKPRRTTPCTYRLSFSMQNDLRAAAKKHEIDQTEIVRSALAFVLPRLLAAPKKQVS